MRDTITVRVACDDPGEPHQVRRRYFGGKTVAAAFADAEAAGWSFSSDRKRAFCPKHPPNTCEHGDHPAPAYKRFCSDACLRCEHESEGDNGCDGICKRDQAEDRCSSTNTTPIRGETLACELPRGHGGPCRSGAWRWMPLDQAGEVDRG